jgi:RsiW-degrading membrane proteinase PrsW (M82 family)
MTSDELNGNTPAPITPLNDDTPAPASVNNTPDPALASDETLALAPVSRDTTVPASGPGEIPPTAPKLPPRRRALTATIAVTSALSVWYLSHLFAPAPALGVSTIAALLPLMLVLVAVHRVDMYLTRPFPEQLTALAVGATVGFTAALLLSTFTAIFLPPELNAGVVEEIVKLTVTLVLAARLSPVRTAAQGATLAMLVAGGVAFTENIAYFVIAAVSGELTTVFVQRGVFSPLAHASFAVCFGLGLGIRHRGHRAVVVGVGLCGAMVLHIMWNTLAIAGSPVLLALPPLQIAQIVTLIEMERRRIKRLEPLLDAAVAGTAPFTAIALDESMRALVTDPRVRARHRAKLPRHALKEFDAWCRCWASLSTEMPDDAVADAVAKAALYRRVWDDTSVDASTMVLRERSTAPVADPDDSAPATAMSDTIDTEPVGGDHDDSDHDDDGRADGDHDPAGTAPRL